MAAARTGRVWAVVPAAGAGRRMAADRPKQYLELAGKPVLVHTLERIAAHPAIHAIVVAVSDGDEYFQPAVARVGCAVIRAPGGKERADSVLGALRHIEAGGGGDAMSEDWALVHDAVRPCLHGEDLDRLIAAALASEHGALLASPTRDTMKRVRGKRVSETVPRDDLWHALTPQMFPLRRLREALEDAVAQAVTVTDETQAMERMGWHPEVVHGRADNIKITRGEDLELAAWFLSRQTP